MPSDKKSFNKFASWASACSAAMAFAIFSSSAASAAPPETCTSKSGAEAAIAAVIEVGSSGVKPAVYEIVQEAAETARSKMRLLCLYPPFNSNLASPSKIRETASSMRDYLDRIESDYGLDRKKVEIVASSGVAKIDNFEGQIRKALAKASDRNPDEIGTVTANQECMFSLNWMAPSADGKSFLIDIGSKNTKACDSRDGWELLPFGTKTFEANVKLELEQSLGEGRDEMKLCDREQPDAIRVFGCAAQVSRKANLANALRLSGAAPEKVFLIGGAPWAAATRLRPDALLAGRNVPFAKSDIDALRSDAIAGRLASYKDTEHYQQLVDDEKKAAETLADNAVGDSGASVFTTTQYIAGLEIILSVLDHYRVGFQPVAAEFAVDGISAWPSWYLLIRIFGDEDGTRAATSALEAPTADNFQRLYTNAAIAQANEKFSAACKTYDKALKAIEDSDSLAALRRSATEVRLMEIRERAAERGMPVKACE